MDWWAQEKLLLSSLGGSSPRKGGSHRLRFFGAGLLLVMWGVLTSWQMRSSFVAHLSNIDGATSARPSARAHGLHNLLRTSTMPTVKDVSGYVRVIIRAHPRDSELVKSLIWSLAAQRNKSPQLEVDFVLVPTEPRCLGELRTIAAGLGSTNTSVKVLELEDDWFAAQETPARFKCSQEDRETEYATHGPEKLIKICDYDNYMYYLATDAALDELLGACEECTHALVTNGDNAYAPNFLEETIRADADLVFTDFAHDRRFMRGVMGRGGLDLGGVLFKTSVLRGGAHTFIRGLPDTAKALEIHDADFWMVQRAIDRGSSLAILHKLLFYHH